MYDSILVPTDGSDHAARAAAHAEYLAGGFDATVRLLSVVDVDAEAGPFSAGGVGEEYLEQLKKGGRDAISDVQASLDGIDARTDVVTGRPSKAILEYADEHGVDLIVMGTHGRTGVRRYVMGSVAERVVSLADVPVLTAQAGEGNRPVEGYDEILVPTDASEAANAAVEYALAVAGQSGGRIHAVNVVNPGAAASPEFTMPTQVLTSLESAGEEATERVAARARETGLDATSAVWDGTPAETILEYADEHGIDLIAMGTTGRTGLSRYLLGSTTEKVIRHADPPVLAVNAGEE